jgi:YD repeat-containing protein
VGNNTLITSALKKETKQVYDQLNRVTQSIDGEKNKTLYGYDSANNLTIVTAANRAQTNYRYDGFKQLLQQDSPDTGITRFTYDTAGNQISKTDASNVTVLYSYDALNRLTKVDYRDDKHDIALEYDTGINGKGRLSKLNDGSGSTLYSYNALGGVSKKTTTVLGKTFEVGYHYDSVGQLNTVTLPSKKVITYVYDTQGKVSDITTIKNDVVSTLLSNIDYVPFGGAKSYRLGNTKVVTKTHNLNGQLSGINVPGTYQSTLSFDADNLITGITNEQNPIKNKVFDYDDANRLTSSVGEYGELGYDYDSSGNRLSNYQSNSQGNNSSTHTYVESTNQLDEGYVHDARGNRTQDSTLGHTRHYRYGDNNRLIETVNDENGVTTQYLYNGLGQRVQKNNALGVIYYLYDEQGLLIAEANATGQIQKEYVYFEGQPLVMLVGE